MSVLIGIATHAGAIRFECVGSLLEMQKDLLDHGIEHDFVIMPGNPYISRARNEITRYFLTTDHENLFFIDDDVGFFPGAVRRLCERPELVVAGVYPKKKHGDEWPARLVTDENGQARPTEDGLYEAEWVPMGFTKIHRSVPLAMIQKYPERVYQECGKTLSDLYPIMVHDHLWLGEDNGFCKLWRDMGGTIHIDPDINFTHSGGYAWHGNYATHLESLYCNGGTTNG